MAGSDAFLAAVKARRTVYTLSSESTIPDARVNEIVQEALRHAPSAFNVQNQRAVVLFGAEHHKFWDMALEVATAALPADRLAATAQRIAGFRGSHGTVMFFADGDATKEQQKAFPLLEGKFPQWSEHANGIAQYIAWTALEAEGLGASLQHYNPGISPRVLEQWKLPTSWILTAQLVFGKPTAAPTEKTFKSIEERFKTFGA